MLSFEIYHPKNNVHNQDSNHDDNKVRITFFFFFELTDNDGQNFLTGIVHIITFFSQKHNFICYNYVCKKISRCYLYSRIGVDPVSVIYCPCTGSL
jgi:hypothetical protein